MLDTKIVDNGDGTFKIMQSGHEAGKLEGGLAQLIAMTWLNLNSIDPVRGADYISGLLNGMTHVTMIANLPSYVPGDKEDGGTADVTG